MTQTTSTESLRLILIGCSKTKKPCKPDRRRGGRITPTEMYGGQLFIKRVQYAERLGLKWFVLSAEYGLWDPTYDRKPYDTTMGEKSKAERAVWHTHTAYRVLSELWEPMERGDRPNELQPDQLTVEIHAGASYSYPLAEILEAVGVNVELPCRGMGIGEQLAMYTSGRLSACPQLTY